MSKKKNSKTTKKILKAKKLYSVNINGEFAVTNKKGAKALLKLMQDAKYERYDEEKENVSEVLRKSILPFGAMPCHKIKQVHDVIYGHYNQRVFKDNEFNADLNVNEDEKIPLDTVISDDSLYGEFIVNELFGVADYWNISSSKLYDMSVFKFPNTPAVLMVNNDDDEFPDMRLGVRINEDTIVVTDFVVSKFKKLTVPARKNLIKYVQETCALCGYPTRNPINLYIEKRATQPYVTLSAAGLKLIPYISSTNKSMEEKLSHATPSEIEASINRGTFFGEYGENHMKEMLDKDQILVDRNQMYSDTIDTNCINENSSHDDSTSDSEITEEKATGVD